MAIRMAPTPVSNSLSANTGPESVHKGPVAVVPEKSPPGGPNAHALLRILHFVMKAHDPVRVAHRAVACLGLLPEVLWAELDGDTGSGPGRISTDLAQPKSSPRQLTLQMVDPNNLEARQAIEQLVAAVREIYRREVEIEKLRDDAQTDPLTGLWNRRGLAPFLEQALARAARTGEDVTVMICDVDHFKQVNDTLGHDAGDRGLIAISHAIRAVVRPSDSAARLGGDEIAVLLSGANAQGATAVAQRLREKLSTATDVALRPGGEQITLSMGIADTHILEDLRGMDAHTRLLCAADQALYLAKAAGRNCWVCHPSSFTPTSVIEEDETSQLPTPGIQQAG